jgi:hypothetical protein
MVLGQSTNAGWHAVTGTGKDLGAPQLIDGYGNGWLVTPTKPGQDMVITLTWTPQRLVWIALVASAFTIVVCVVLALWPRRRRRGRGDVVTVPAGPAGPYRSRPPMPVQGPASVPAMMRSAGSETAPPGAPAASAMRGADESGNDVDVDMDDIGPSLASPLRSGGARPRWSIIVVASVVAGGVTSAIVVPGAGIPVAAATLVALAIAYGRGLLALASVGMLVAVDWIVTSSQGSSDYLAEFGWPTHFGVSNLLAWLAVAALGADALVQELRDRRTRRAPDGGVGRNDLTSEPNRKSTWPRRQRRRRGKHVRSV